jgi:hypothetical protein
MRKHHGKKHGKHDRRNLRQADEFDQFIANFMQMGNTDCDSISTEDQCNAASCSWCRSAAVKSSCKTIEQAEALPSAIFDCSNLPSEDDEEEDFEIPVPVVDPISPFFTASTCGSNTDQNSCDSVADCTWCKSAAVKSSCNSIEDAKSLPPSIFSCDKLQEEEVPEVSVTPVPIRQHHKRGGHMKHHGIPSIFSASSCGSNTD